MTNPRRKGPCPACPNCGSNNTCRSLRKPEELQLRDLLFKTPYRCKDCDHRFFGFRLALARR